MNISNLFIQSLTVGKIYQFYREKRLIVNRKYQRKLCWTIEEKRNFIDTILKGYPVPLFLLAEKENDQYEIVDGMQRLEAICSFIEQRYNLKDGYFNLQSTPLTMTLYNQNKLHQKTSIMLSTECAKFFEYPLSVSIFKADKKEVETIFKRLNSTGKHLSKQELRQAGITSKFAMLVNKISERIRGDSSDNKLQLNQMANISISNYKLNYGIHAKYIFWVKNEIIHVNELRYSRDEEIIAQLLILIKISLNNEWENSNSNLDGGILDKYYNYKMNPLDYSVSSESISMESFIENYGSDEIEKQFDKVFLEMEELIHKSGKTFRKLINKPKKENDCVNEFSTLFLALFKAIICENKTLKKEALIEKISTVSKELKYNSKTIKGIRNQMNMVYGLLSEGFINTDRNKDILLSDLPNQIRYLLQHSRTEGTLFDFKIGIVQLGGNKINEDTFQKIIKTLTAINNTGPKQKGYIFLGIADNEDDAIKYKRQYGVNYVMESGFPIMGVECDCMALKLTVDTYLHTLTEKIRQNKNIESGYRNHIVQNIRSVKMLGKTVILLTTNYNKVLTFGDRFYIRSGTDTKEVRGEEINSLFQSFYNN